MLKLPAVSSAEMSRRAPGSATRRQHSAPARLHGCGDRRRPASLPLDPTLSLRPASASPSSAQSSLLPPRALSAHLGPASGQSAAPAAFNLPWRPHPPMLRHDVPLDQAPCALHDASGAADRPTCIAKLLALRASMQAGQPHNAEMLTAFTAIARNNAMRLLLDRQYFADLLPALYAAKQSIHIAVLTFDDSPIGRAIVDLLVAKKTHDPRLRVRVIFDNFGSWAMLPWSPQVAMARRMRQAGIDVVINNLVTEGLEHRKIAIIDGKIGYMGGSCLGKQYYGSETYWRRFAALARQAPDDVADVFRRKYDPTCQPNTALSALDDAPDVPQFHDFAMRCEGEIVAYLQAAFLQSWLLHRQSLDPGDAKHVVTERYFPPPSPVGHLPTKLVNSMPGGNSEIGPTLLEVVAAAEHTLDLTFAYILVPQFVEVLAAAARRGVKIRLLVPGEAHIDIPPAYYAFRAHYPRLFAAGNVEIFEFRQYTHIKLMVADHRLVLASTGNPEWDSWERAFDETAVVDSSALARLIETRVFTPDMSPAWATQATPESYAQMGRWARTKTHVCRWMFDTFFRVRTPATAV